MLKIFVSHWFLLHIETFYMWNTHGFHQSLFCFISSDRLINLKPDSRNKIKISDFILFYRPPDSAKIARNWVEYRKLKKASPNHFQIVEWKQTNGTVWTGVYNCLNWSVRAVCVPEVIDSCLDQTGGYSLHCRYTLCIGVCLLCALQVHCSSIWDAMRVLARIGTEWVFFGSLLTNLRGQTD